MHLLFLPPSNPHIIHPKPQTLTPNPAWAGNRGGAPLPLADSRRREAGPPNHHNDKVDSDQQVVNKELSLLGQAIGGQFFYPSRTAAVLACLCAITCNTTTAPNSSHVTTTLPPTLSRARSLSLSLSLCITFTWLSASSLSASSVTQHPLSHPPPPLSLNPPPRPPRIPFLSPDD